LKFLDPPLDILPPSLDNLGGGGLALGSNYKYSSKINDKMLNLSTKTYNNEQVSMVLIGRTSAQTCQKRIILVLNPPNRQTLGALQFRFRFRLDSFRKCAKTLLPLNIIN